MRTVPLRGKLAAGRVALIDDEDWDLVSQYQWNVLEMFRAGRVNGPYARAKSGPQQILMHNLITGWPRVDHIDFNGLNNQRSNLRPATALQNKANQRPRLDSVSSAFKGVSWQQRPGRAGRWIARIMVDGHRRTIGRFLDEEAAARAYDAAALAAWGEYAWLNFPDDPPA